MSFVLFALIFRFEGGTLGEGSFFTFVYTPGMLALSKCPGFQSAKLQHFDFILKGFHSRQK